MPGSPSAVLDVVTKPGRGQAAGGQKQATAGADGWIWISFPVAVQKVLCRAEKEKNGLPQTRLLALLEEHH